MEATSEQRAFDKADRGLKMEERACNKLMRLWKNRAPIRTRVRRRDSMPPPAVCSSSD